ncbi:MAG: serine hydrolase [Flavobacteriaceae bacterium]|nr:MAG: serine hydrolase [Flavobacteriaceae bacterium]
MKKLLTFVFLCTFLLIKGQTKEQVQHLDAYFTKSFQEWNIPGMAIAIVSADSIYLSKGYGLSNLQTNKAVDEHTLFAVASNSKAFTASALAQLVDAGKLKWEDKVVNYLPYFKMYDNYVTQHFTIADLLSHRSGLATFSGDLLWYATSKTPKEIIQAQQYLQPVHDFRTDFGYSNISYLAAGQIIEKISGKSWKSYIQEAFLSPLNMHRTLTSTLQLTSSNNIATPYFTENGKNNQLKWVNWDNIAPAGAIISSVHDFSKWLQLNLKEGTIHGKEYFSTKQFNQMTTPHINFSVRKNAHKKHFSSYGMGWNLEDYEGVKVISHAGGYDGMISKSFFIPEKDLAVIIVTNSVNWLPGALSNKIMDVLIGDNMEDKDWSADYLVIKKRRDKQQLEKENKLELQRGKLSKTHLNLKEYTGTYTDQMYGNVTVELKKGILNFQMEKTSIFHADLKHWNHQIFTFRFDTSLCSLPQGKLWFDLDKEGKINQLHIDIENPDFDFTEFTFRKQ